MKGDMSKSAVKPSLAQELLTGSNVERYAAVLHAYLVRRLRRPDDAEDLTQEIFTRFIRKCESNEEVVRDPLAFLLGIAGYVVRESMYDDRHRRVTFDSVLVDEATENPAHTPHSSDTAEQVGMRQDILAAISKLPENLLVAWYVVDCLELSYEEAAAATGFARNTVSAYVTQARATLKIILDDYWANRGKRS